MRSLFEWRVGVVCLRAANMSYPASGAEQGELLRHTLRRQGHDDNTTRSLVCGGGAVIPVYESGASFLAQPHSKLRYWLSCMKSASHQSTRLSELTSLPVTDSQLFFRDIYGEANELEHTETAYVSFGPIHIQALRLSYIALHRSCLSSFSHAFKSIYTS